MDLEQAHAALDRAVTDYLAALNEDTDTAVPDGWLLISSCSMLDEPGVGQIGIAHSVNLAAHIQLGLLQFMLTRLKAQIAAEVFAEEDEDDEL